MLSMPGNIDQKSLDMGSPSMGTGAVDLLEGLPPAAIAYTAVNAPKPDRALLVDRLIKSLQRIHHFTSKARLSEYCLEKDALGRPALFFGDVEGPSISFSLVPGSTWAAMSGVKGLGIDAALPEEFNPPYPAHRVFGRGEFDRASELCGGVSAEASAFLWSAKEAAVKALGCGFHFFGPLEIKVGKIRPVNRGYYSHLDAGMKVPVWTRRQGRLWVSIAWIES
jgi:phosphopantetheinyl transferase